MRCIGCMLINYLLSTHICNIFISNSSGNNEHSRSRRSLVDVDIVGGLVVVKVGTFLIIEYDSLISKYNLGLLSSFLAPHRTEGFINIVLVQD